MTVIKIRLSVPDEFVDPTSDTGITERGFLTIAEGLNVGQLIDITPEPLTHTGETHDDHASNQG